MSAKKKQSKKDKASEVNEPVMGYTAPTIHFFNSLDEMGDFQLAKMAKMNPEQSLNKLDALRRIFLKDYLLPDGSWKPIERVIKFRKPFV